MHGWDSILTAEALFHGRFAVQGQVCLLLDGIATLEDDSGGHDTPAGWLGSFVATV